MKLLVTLFFGFSYSVILHAQPLMDGMSIITNKTGFNINGFNGFSSYSFQIFDAGNNLSAPLGQNWQPTFYILVTLIFMHNGKVLTWEMCLE
jgi:hypothetical protein